MRLNRYLDTNPEAAAALAEGKPVVAPESTIIKKGTAIAKDSRRGLQDALI